MKIFPKGTWNSTLTRGKFVARRIVLRFPLVKTKLVSIKTANGLYRGNRPLIMRAELLVANVPPSNYIDNHEPFIYIKNHSKNTVCLIFHKYFTIRMALWLIYEVNDNFGLFFFLLTQLSSSSISKIASSLFPSAHFNLTVDFRNSLQENFHYKLWNFYPYHLYYLCLSFDDGFHVYFAIRDLDKFK